MVQPTGQLGKIREKRTVQVRCGLYQTPSQGKPLCEAQSFLSGEVEREERLKREAEGEGGMDSRNGMCRGVRGGRGE